MQLGINRLIRMESSVMELAGGGEGEGRRRGSNGAEWGGVGQSYSNFHLLLWFHQLNGISDWSLR